MLSVVKVQGYIRTGAKIIFVRTNIAAFIIFILKRTSDVTIKVIILAATNISLFDVLSIL